MNAVSHPKNTRKSTWKKNIPGYKVDGTMDVVLLSYLTHARTCTIFAWVYGEDVDAVCSTWIVPSNKNCAPKTGKENTIVMNEGFGWWSHFLHGGESWIFYQTVPRPLWFSKSKLYGHTWNIYNFASYLWFKKSQNNREAVLNRSTSYSAVYNCDWNFSQTEGECIKWHDKRFPLVHFPSPVGSLEVDKLHTTVFDISPREIHLSGETI